MTKQKKQDKLVSTAATKRNATPRVSVDSKVREKFWAKLNKVNKSLDKNSQISKTQAATEALRLWMERHSI
jgi:hypothetical protein